MILSLANDMPAHGRDEGPSPRRLRETGASGALSFTHRLEQTIGKYVIHFFFEVLFCFALFARVSMKSFDSQLYSNRLSVYQDLLLFRFFRTPIFALSSLANSRQSRCQIWLRDLAVTSDRHCRQWHFIENLQNFCW